MILTEYKNHKNAAFDQRLLWDVDLSKFDFRDGKHAVIERTVEVGSLNDWYFILNFYGEEIVIEEIKKINSLMSRDISFVHKFLSIPLSELRSYQNQLKGKKHWFE